MLVFKLVTLPVFVMVLMKLFSLNVTEKPYNETCNPSVPGMCDLAFECIKNQCKCPENFHWNGTGCAKSKFDPII